MIKDFPLNADESSEWIDLGCGMRQCYGFTLIELLIGIVIGAILLSVAIPSYRNFVVRANLTEAFDALSAYRINMEQAYQDLGNYGNGGCAVPLPAANSFNYTCTLTNGGQGFLATATGNGNNNVTGYAFTINEAGIRTTTNFPEATVPTNCWLIRPGGC